MVFLKNAHIFKKVKLINHDCLPILMLYIVLAYLMLFAALTNAVCLNNAFLSLICANAFYFHALSLFTSFFLFHFFYLHHAQCF